MQSMTLLKPAYTCTEQELGTVLAADLAPLLKTGDVVTLRGELGAGKTAFAKALIRHLAGSETEVPSPTFTLVQTYDVPRFTIWHFDLYRLDDQKNNILELGWDDARREGVILVEWPERLSSLLPKDRLEIDIDFIKDSDNKRHITLKGYGAWATKLRKAE